jgi:heptosyltransferase-1
MIKQLIKNLIKPIIDSIIKLELVLYTQQTNYNKLLIIRPDNLGDFILFSPTIKYYHQLFPNKQIDILIAEINQELTEYFIPKNNQIILDNHKFSNNLFYRHKFLINLAKQGYHTAIYPVYSRSTNGDLIVRATRAQIKIGIDGDDNNISKKQLQKNNRLYTKLITIPKEIISELARNTFFIKILGAQFKTEMLLPEIQPDDNHRAQADELLKQNNLLDQNFCIIFPGAGKKFRIWPTKNYAAIADYLITQNIIPIICGVKSEQYLAQEINNQSNATIKITDLTGQTTIMTLAALLQKAKFYLGSDTGPLHLTCAVGTPVICLLGRTGFMRFFPYNQDTLNNKQHYVCSTKIIYNGKYKPTGKEKIDPLISDITIEQIKTKINEIIKTT